MFQVKDTYALLPKFDTETSRQVIDRRDYGHANVGIIVWFGSEHIQSIHKVYRKEWSNPEDREEQATRLLKEVADQIKQAAAEEGRI
ncbi:hypothetical protein D3C76_676470 [compost metagenome]